MIDVLAFLFAMALTAATAYLIFQRGFNALVAWAPVMAIVSLFVLAQGFAASFTAYATYGEVCATVTTTVTLTKTNTTTVTTTSVATVTTTTLPGVTTTTTTTVTGTATVTTTVPVVENATAVVCRPEKVIYDPHGFGLVAAIVGLAHLLLYGALTAFYPIARRRIWS